MNFHISAVPVSINAMSVSESSLTSSHRLIAQLVEWWTVVDAPVHLVKQGSLVCWFKSGSKERILGVYEVANSLRISSFVVSCL